MTMSAEETKKRFEERGQAHVFRYWEDLAEEERAALLADCADVDFDWLEARVAQFRREEEAGEATTPPELEPASVIRLPRGEDERAIETEARELGEEALRAGRVGAFLVAGGQGTRLGFDGPKGCFPVGPVSERTLFHWHAEQIRARARRYGVVIPWYIMTGPGNDTATRAFFAENDYLGFAPEDVVIFQQAVVPSVDFDGKLLLAERHRLATNPDGHGGSLRALVRSGATEDMKRRGIDTLSYFQVDNPLVTVADPVFVGYHLEAHADMSSKALRKAFPEEKVGVFCRVDGRLTVIEYSDLDDANMYAKGADGELRFWAGSIAIHMLSVPFVEQMGCTGGLPWHVARKKIPHVEAGERVEPETPNGVKFEQFVFDALPHTSSSITLEVAREEEFAPVKNPSGVDSAESCRRLLSDRFGRWIEAAGGSVPRDEEGRVAVHIEISPLYALDAEEYARQPGAARKVEEDLLLDADAEAGG